MDDGYKKANYINWSINVAVILALDLFYIIYCLSVSIPLKWGVFALFTLIPIVIAFGPVTDRRQLMRKALYVVTNARVFVAKNDEILCSYPLSSDVAVRTEALANGAYAIFFGEACKKPLHRARRLALLGLTNDEKESIGLVFYSVPDASEVLSVLPGRPSMREGPPEVA